MPVMNMAIVDTVANDEMTSRSMGSEAAVGDSKMLTRQFPVTQRP